MALEVIINGLRAFLVSIWREGCVLFQIFVYGSYFFHSFLLQLIALFAFYGSTFCTYYHFLLLSFLIAFNRILSRLLCLIQAEKQDINPENNK